jgi:hypothetical protein
MLSVEVHRTTSLRFDDGSPVRAASVIAPFGSGWLVAQDDATHAAWWRDDAVTPLGGSEAVDGAVPLGITDAVALEGGRVLVSAVAEDTDDPVADGPVSAAALAVLDGEELVAWTLLPADTSGAVPEVEGLAILAASADTLELFAAPMIPPSPHRCCT